MQTRRAIAKMLGIAPIAASSAAAELSSIMGEKAAVTVGAASLNQAQSLVGGSIASPLQTKFGKEMAEKIFGLERRAQREADLRQNFRHHTGGIDADIAVLRSISAQYKIRKQIDRDAEAIELSERIQRFMWG